MVSEDPAWGSPGRSQPTPLAADPPGTTRVSEETGTTPVSEETGTTRVSEETGTTWVSEETGRSGACDIGRANVGAATPTPRMLAEATPPSKIRQLLTKHSTSR